jgi:hypothetical protein
VHLLGRRLPAVREPLLELISVRITRGRVDADVDQLRMDVLAFVVETTAELIECSLIHVSSRSQGAPGRVCLPRDAYGAT